MLKIWNFIKSIIGLILNVLILFFNLIIYILLFQSSDSNSNLENTIFILSILFSISSLVIFYKITKNFFFSKKTSKFVDFLSIISIIYVLVVLSILIFSILE
jgi:hypothetical protein